LQSHLTWDKLSHSCIGSSSFLARLSFPWRKNLFFLRWNGRTYPGPPLEAVGLWKTKQACYLYHESILLVNICTNRNLSRSNTLWFFNGTNLLPGEGKERSTKCTTPRPR